MGEIVDLESYRRRIKRKAPRPQGTGNRRNPDRAVPRGDLGGLGDAGDSGGLGGNHRDPRFGAPGGGSGGGSGKAGPAGNTKIEPSDPKSD